MLTQEEKMYDRAIEKLQGKVADLSEKNQELVQTLREIDEQLGDKQTLALTRILKDIVTNALKKY